MLNHLTVKSSTPTCQGEKTCGTKFKTRDFGQILLREWHKNLPCHVRIKSNEDGKGVITFLQPFFMGKMLSHPTARRIYSLGLAENTLPKPVSG
jgi:hypothetical protein